LLLSVTVSAPKRLPASVGVKLTATVQLPFTATGIAGEQLVPAAAMPKGPEVAIALMVRLAVPLFVSVTVCDALVVPTTWEVAKVTLVGARVAMGAATPVPLKEIVCVLLAAGALSVKVTEPTALPATVGVKTTLTVHMPWGATGEVQVLVSCCAKGAVATTEATVRFAVPVLVTVTIWAALLVPRATLPKVRLVAESNTAGAPTPVPDSGTTWVLAAAPLLLSVTVSAP
jgi:hypothetical protein